MPEVSTCESCGDQDALPGHSVCSSCLPDLPEDEHVVLVAFGVYGATHGDAQERLMARLVPLLQSKDPTSSIECWWIAHDVRRDGSDLESAVFVPEGIPARDARHIIDLAVASGALPRDD